MLPISTNLGVANVCQDYVKFAVPNRRLASLRLATTHFDAQQVLGQSFGDRLFISAAYFLARGFSASLSPSPTRLMASTVINTAKPGNVAIHQPLRR